jgi:hypothetical protein
VVAGIVLVFTALLFGARRWLKRLEAQSPA